MKKLLGYTGCIFVWSGLLLAAILAMNPVFAETSDRAAEASEKPDALGGDFVLTDHHGNRFDSTKLRGQLVLVFFGYTYCPDICPAELSLIAKVVRQLGPDRDKVTPLFISVDPERDTPEQLNHYVSFFSPELIGLTGSEEELLEVVSDYRVQRKLNIRHDGDRYYTVDHSANLFILGRNGQVTNIVPNGIPAEHVLDIVKYQIKNQFTEQL